MLPTGPGVLSFLQSRQQQARQSDCSPEGGQPQRPLSEMMAAPARGGDGDGGDGREPEGEGGREEREAMEQEQRDATGEAVMVTKHGVQILHGTYCYVPSLDVRQMTKT